MTKTRTLTSKWTVELEHDDNPEFGENLGEEVTKILQEEIDWGVLCDMMLQLGWSKVLISKATANLFYSTPSTIETWVEENIKGKSRGRGTTWLFEDEKDAMWFKMRWS